MFASIAHISGRLFQSKTRKSKIQRKTRRSDEEKKKKRKKLERRRIYMRALDPDREREFNLPLLQLADDDPVARQQLQEEDWNHRFDEAGAAGPMRKGGEAGRY